MRVLKLFRALIVIAGTALAGVVSAAEVTVFAAASMKDALEQVGIAWRTQTGHELLIVPAGSSILARQIDQGAPADIFISANQEWMDWLGDRGLIDISTRFDLLGNELVLIAHEPDIPIVEIDENLDLAGMLGEDYLAMALVDAVPAGIYGRTALQSLGLWEPIADRVVQSDNVRSALILVATGETPFGVVYASDAQADNRVNAIGRFPAHTHPAISYPVAALAESRNPLNAEFLEFLRTEPARAIFTEQGFLIQR